MTGLVKMVHVYVPKDRVTNLHQTYGFIEFQREEDADYVLNIIKLYGKPIRVNKDVDEKLFYDTFSAFGVIAANPKIMQDPDTGNSRGFGFISYDFFEASDAAIEAITGQYLCNRQITVSYAYKKDTKGERHGTPTERLLAANNPSSQKTRPHTLFASGPPTHLNAPQANAVPRPFGMCLSLCLQVNLLLQVAEKCQSMINQSGPDGIHQVCYHKLIRNVLLRQGVLGIKVKVMLDYNPKGKLLNFR